MTATGGCQCGDVRYAIDLDRLVGYACHCRECQKQSASAFGLSIPVRRQSIRFEGAMAHYVRPTDSGSRTTCWFCSACGSRIYHESARPSSYLTLKGGSLDDIAAMKLAAHIWVSRKLPWVALDPGLPAFETQPADLDAWRESLLSSAWSISAGAGDPAA